MKDEILIVGAGFSGAVSANILANNGEKILVIDRRKHIAGNAFDSKDEKTGIITHNYGPHIFHTNNDIVWNFLSKYTDWHNFEFKPKVVINGKFITLPFNLNSLYESFSNEKAKTIEDALIKEYGYGNKVAILELLENKNKSLKFIANYVYENVFANYSSKQWGIPVKDIDKNILKRVPVVISRDDRYFQDKYQGIPSKGYTNLIQNILTHKNIKLRLNTEFYDLKNEDFKKIIYTGSIDELFDYKYGVLPYRSLEFKTKLIDKEYYQPSAMVNYPNDYEYTRIVEHKYFLNQNAKQTIVTEEYPQKFIQGKNERYYPIKNDENIKLYNMYKAEAAKNPKLYLLGRLGEYKYYNMEEVILNAINLAKNIIEE